MKRNKYLLIIFFVACLTACQKLDIPPINIVQDDDIFTSEAGITAYFARSYSQLPIEDFKYSAAVGFSGSVVGSPHAVSGEALSRDMNQNTETFSAYWGGAYNLIRECNYFLETLPKYASHFTPEKVNSWLAEARFIRAVTYFALVKRYGGVPIVNKLLAKPGQTITELTASLDELKVPRAAEEAVYDSIAADLDYAYANLPESNRQTRADKYVAAAFKSRAMLFAGTVAKYNLPGLTLTVDGVQVVGIPASKAAAYFKASYDAAALLNGKYSLYKKNWIAGDKNAQYQNYVNLFLDTRTAGGNPEVIFVRQYKLPDAAHSWDALSVPKQLEGPNGNYSSETNPTLNFVEMFEGFPKNPDGTIQVLNGAGQYILFDNVTDLFANAEPRLRATVILPGHEFKGQNIEFRRGIYTGSAAGGINKLVPIDQTVNYPTANILSAASVQQNTPVDMTNGARFAPAGASGIFSNLAANGPGGSISGFSVRKYLDPFKPTADVQPVKSEQAWIEIRYAEVMLNSAEAAYELYSLGQGANYLQHAIDNINLIRERAGATQLTTITDVNTIRIERRKELAFENKIYWDLRRWRILDQEQNNTAYKVLLPFYSQDAGKFFFDPRLDERGVRYTFPTRSYYSQIPPAAIQKSPNLVQNPGY
mgnify:CR=1 FL=1